MSRSTATAPAEVSATAPWASPAAQDRLRFLEQTHTEAGQERVAASIAISMAAFRRRTDIQGVSLYAGSNVVSPAVEAAHQTTMATRPALGWPGDKVQPGVQEIEELEVIASRQVARSMGARFAEVRFLTATMANLAAYIAFTEPGDTIAILSPESGSHASHQQQGTAGIRGLHTEYLPYNRELFDVDPALVNGFVDRVRPKLILVGGSVALFPHDLAVVRAAADRVGAILLYDASHTAGLIAAGLFQNPLEEGAHAVTFSTYKTFAGPAGGAAVTNDPVIAEKLSHAAYPVLSSNYDASRLGPLAIAAAEAVEQSPRWAAQTVALAQAVGGRLDELGLKVLGNSRGYTQTHQVVVDASEHGGGQDVVRKLERVGLYTGACRIPEQSPEAGPQGLRLGLQEAVRRGATMAHADRIAEIIHQGITSWPGKLDTAQIAHLRQSFGHDIWGRPASGLNG
jgi:glycine hydroxymethyltransferase